MIVNLRENKARLTRATEAEASDMALWAEELQKRLNSQPAKGEAMVHWLDLDREDRSL